MEFKIPSTSEKLQSKINDRCVESFAPKPSTKDALATAWAHCTDRFYHTETLLRKRLEENTAYPFHQTVPDVFALHVTRRHMVFGFLFCVVFNPPISAILFVWLKMRLEYLIVPVILFVIYIPLTYYNWNSAFLVYDRAKALYEVYWQNHVIYQGHSHNLYIRLIAETLDDSPTYYSLVLSGYLFREYRITGPVPSYEKLRQIGRKMAANLGLNYFDYDRISTHHLVRVRCPHLADPEF